ncbi:unnamed protein product [Taenia asiatica]|uniref:Histone H2A n=1 Tax=Taenia asiatica TaxID=60517 RepID=A0A0R3W063_TAEAS|nr:unnamed protein product [Taenia asiatica]
MRRGCRYGEVYSFPLFVCTDCCAVATTRSVWMLECRSTGLLCSLEYLAVEVVDLPSNATRDSEKTHIIPRYLHLVIPNDEKLNKLMGDATIAGGDVLPNVEAVLLPKKTQEEVSSKDRLID